LKDSFFFFVVLDFVLTLFSRLSKRASEPFFFFFGAPSRCCGADRALLPLITLNYFSSLPCSPYAATAATVRYALDLLVSRLTSEEAYELLAPIEPRCLFERPKARHCGTSRRLSHHARSSSVVKHGDPTSVGHVSLPLDVQPLHRLATCTALRELRNG
jgi:hypothetical protein